MKRGSGKANEHVTISDYGLQWKLSVPEALKDEFITEFALSQAQTIEGSLDVFVFLQPTDKLYLQLPGKPAGVFHYSVNMVRDKSVPLGKLAYPYLSVYDSDVELQDFFGY